ncbi:MAG: C40 family peptidase [Clostridium sp.]|nr:C40 family peptidase [Prevotella sp.]MCM1428759.1 C40 family peptidase [Clostridium sp.]MCM1475134.1 C40 family peptidase [Muribaculaceae bacterium]
MKRINSLYTILLLSLLSFGAATLSSCSSSKKSVKAVAVRESPIIHPSHLSKAQKRLVNEAESWLGTPYVYAAAEKGKGTDCSGFVMKLYSDVFDMKLPRNSAKQAEFCTPLKKKDVTTGDLVFFATGKDKTKVSHVGIMLDTESFIHASSSKGVVVSRMSNPYYTRNFLMYGRIPQFTALSKL